MLRDGPHVQPRSADAEDLIGFGWEIAEATLAAAPSELTLVTHWFATGEDDSVNADDHFGSNERTLRFLGVALPTLIDQLSATMAVVAFPWDLEGEAPSLNVVAVALGGPPVLVSRPLTRLEAGSSPPFWRLEPGLLIAPAPLTQVATKLAAFLDLTRD